MAKPIDELTERVNTLTRAQGAQFSIILNHLKAINTRRDDLESQVNARFDMLDEMKPALVVLSIRGTAMTEYLENADEFALTIEQMNELRMNYQRAARRVEHAFSHTTFKTQGFQLG